MSYLGIVNNNAEYFVPHNYKTELSTIKQTSQAIDFAHSVVDNIST